MPILSEEKKKRQSLLLILTILFLGGAGIVLLQRILKSRTPDTVIPGEFIEGIPGKLFGEETPLPSTAFERLDTVELDRGIFDDPRFASLTTNGLLPIVVKQDEVGRGNPFIPFVL